MKCRYCGRKTAGNAHYCSTYCKERGQSQLRFAQKTRLPFLIAEIPGILSILVGITLTAAQHSDKGFLFIGAGLGVSGIGLLAFPRAGRNAHAFCKTGGCILFALCVAILMLWW